MFSKGPCSTSSCPASLSKVGTSPSPGGATAREPALEGTAQCCSFSESLSVHRRSDSFLGTNTSARKHDFFPNQSGLAGKVLGVEEFMVEASAASSQ